MYKPRKCRFWKLYQVVALTMGFAAFSAAGEPSTASMKASPLRIESDSWLTKGKEGIRKFEGNVRLSKGHLLLTADSLEERSPTDGERSLLAIGQPAALTLRDPSREKTFNARANRILFELASNTLILSGRAHLATAFKGQPDSIIDADSIRIQVVGERPTRMDAKGNPLTFARTNPDGRQVEAQATSLSMLEATGVVTLQQASLKVGNSQTQAPTIIYNSETGDVQASSKGDDRPTVIVEWPDAEQAKTEKENQP